MVVEEHFDKNKAQYLKDEQGHYYVPVSLESGTPTPVMPVAEIFKVEE